MPLAAASGRQQVCTIKRKQLTSQSARGNRKKASLENFFQQSGPPSPHVKETIMKLNCRENLRFHHKAGAAGSKVVIPCALAFQKPKTGASLLSPVSPL